MTKNWRVIALVLAALTVVVAGYFLVKKTKPAEEVVEVNGETPTEVTAGEGEVTDDEETTPTTTPTTRRPTTTTPTAMTYDEVYNLYRNLGLRFQFLDCHGSPGSLTMKVGTKFMLDNRDVATHIIMVGSTKYTIGGQNYAIATASTLGTHNITCDGGGAAEVRVQP